MSLYHELIQIERLCSNRTLTKPQKCTKKERSEAYEAKSKNIIAINRVTSIEDKEIDLSTQKYKRDSSKVNPTSPQNFSNTYTDRHSHPKFKSINMKSNNRGRQFDRKAERIKQIVAYLE